MYSLVCSILADKDFHLCLCYCLLSDKGCTVDDGNSGHRCSHGNCRLEVIAQSGAAVKAEVLHLADISDRRFRCTFGHSTIPGKGRCTLGNMLYHSRFRHLSVLLEEEIVFTNCQTTSTLVAHNLQQLVHHHDGRALGYEFFNLTDGSRCSHTGR